MVVSIAASVRAADSTLPIPRDYARALVFEIGRRLSVPAAVVVDTWEPARLSMLQDRETGFMSLSAVIELRARRGAPPDQVAFLASSLSPELDVALQAAIDRLVADRAGALPDSMRTPRRVHVSIDTRLYPDSAQTVLFEMRTPLVEFDSLARFEPSSPRPNPPAHVRRTNAGGHVKVRFVVDAGGRMVGSSLRILHSDEPAFADAVAAALLFTRFHPATIGGCRVPSVLELLYQFSTY